MGWPGQWNILGERGERFWQAEEESGTGVSLLPLPVIHPDIFADGK